MQKMRPNSDWEKLPGLRFVYEQDDLSQALESDEKYKPLVNDRKTAGINAKLADIKVALFASAYKKKYASRNQELLPEYARQLIRAIIEDLRYNKRKNDLKRQVLMAGSSHPNLGITGRIGKSNSLAVVPVFGGLSHQEIDTMPWQLREFLKTFLEMQVDDESSPGLGKMVSEIFDLGAVKGLIRESAEIPPIKDEIKATAFLAMFSADEKGPELLEREAAEMITASGAGGGGPAAGGDPRARRPNFRGLLGGLGEGGGGGGGGPPNSNARSTGTMVYEEGEEEEEDEDEGEEEEEEEDEDEGEEEEEEEGPKRKRVKKQGGGYLSRKHKSHRSKGLKNKSRKSKSRKTKSHKTKSHRSKGRKTRSKKNW